MSKYAEFLPEMHYMPLFKDLSDEEIINLLEAMQPEIAVRKAGELMTPENSMDIPNDIFCFVVRGKPLEQCREILDVYTNNPPGEPGMMMGEIPVLSQILKSKAPRQKGGKPPHGNSPAAFDTYMLRFTPDQITRFYNEDVAPAQGIMLKNFLGLLAQKVTDVRKEKRAVEEKLEALENN